MGEEQPSPAFGRPRLVTYAVYLIFASAALGLLSEPFGGLNTWNGEGGVSVLLCALALRLIPVLIAFALGRSILSRSNRGRFLYAAWILLGVVLTLMSARGWLEQWSNRPVTAALGNAAFLMQLAALILVFLPMSNAWFRPRTEIAHDEAAEQLLDMPKADP